jgi:hypothetical protein
MPDRDLDITKFGYEAYRRLKKTLGEFDAVVEFNEIAIREFIEHAHTEYPAKYIQALSHKHKVKVNEVNFIKFGSRIRQYYIASVYQQFDQFLTDFKDEWKLYFNDIVWTNKEDGETKLSNILKNTNISISSDLIDCIEYYRLVRNYMAHTDRDIKEIKKRYQKLCSNKNDFLNELTISAIPNELDNINFDDFLFFTNLIKHITFILCINSKPSNQRIAEILFDKAKLNGGGTIQGLKKLKNKSDRYEIALRSYISSSFGRFSLNDIKDVADNLKCLLA